MKTGKKQRIKNLNQLYYGDEPIFSPSIEPHSSIEIISALSFYNIQLSQDDAKNELLKYAEQHYPNDIVKQLEKLKWVCNVGAMCRMYSRGCVFKDSNIIHHKIMKLLENVPDTTIKKEEIKKISAPKIVDDNKQKYYASIIITYIEDEALRRTFVKPSNLQKFLDLNQVPISFYKQIGELVVEHSCELNSAIDKTDQQLVEAYSNYGKKDLRLYKELYDYFINFLLQKRERKKRKIKPIDINKKISKVQYLKECSELGIKSIEPKEILDKQFVILYNTRYKTLSILFGKFDIRGTTIYGLDETKCVKKTLRKPEEFLKELLTIKTIDGTMKLFNSLKTKEQVPVGTINNNTLILKVL